MVGRRERQDENPRARKTHAIRNVFEERCNTYAKRREFILTNEEFILLAARSRFEFNWQKRDFEMLHSYLH